MSILQRYVTREILAPFGITFLVITFLMFVGELFHQLSDRFMGKGLAIADLAMLACYVLPSLVIYTIPISLLLATLLAFIQLSQDSEITALKAAGVPTRTVFVPAILIGAVTTLVLLAMWAEVAPWSRRQISDFIIRTVLAKPTLVLTEQAWTHAVDDMRIFVGRIEDEQMLLEDINIQINKEGSPHRMVVAKEGKIRIDPTKEQIYLQLLDGAIHEYDMEKPDQYSTTAFKSLVLPVTIASLDRYVKRYHTLQSVRTKEMSLLQILRRFQDPSVGPRERNELLGHIGERTALAFMPLVFVLIGAPLGIIPHKARRFYGPVACLGLLLAYYSLLVIGEALSEKQLVNPLLAMWIPNLLLGASGVGFMIRAETL
ncbi:MAG: LPS export ABC transporter permease LptF [Candidatus Abyssubacteria bacterium]